MDSQHATDEPSCGQEPSYPSGWFFPFFPLTGPGKVCRQSRVLLDFRDKMPNAYGFPVHV
jgi:hypothetical protein